MKKPNQQPITTSLNQNILEQAEKLSEASVNYVETQDLDAVNTLTDNMSSVVVETSALYLMIKNMRQIVKNDGKRQAIKVHELFSRCLSVFFTNGEARIYEDGNSGFIVLFDPKTTDTNKAVKYGLKLTHLFSRDLAPLSEKFNNISFGIGIDHGRVMGVNIGHPVWFGTCIEKAKKISEECLKPCYLGISGRVHSQLGDDLQTVTRHILGIPKKENMWIKSTYQFENERKHLYQTYHSLEND